MSDPSTEGAYLLPLTTRYKNLKAMADLSGFDVVFSHPLAPAQAKAAKSGGARAEVVAVEVT